MLVLLIVLAVIAVLAVVLSVGGGFGGYGEPTVRRRIIHRRRPVERVYTERHIVEDPVGRPVYRR